LRDIAETTSEPSNFSDRNDPAKLMVLANFGAGCPREIKYSCVTAYTPCLQAGIVRSYVFDCDNQKLLTMIFPTADLGANRGTSDASRETEPYRGSGERYSLTLLRKIFHADLNCQLARILASAEILA
jgi:hypothetical protein